MNRIIDQGTRNKSYRGLPALAGIASMTDAIRPGLSVEECVTRLKRYHFGLKRLHEIFMSRIPAEPVYELKMAFSLHSHYCAEHVAALRKRVSEMREPPLGLDQIPNDDLQLFFDEILSAPDTASLLLGVYAKAIPALIAGMRRHIRDTNIVVDHPSVRVCRFALLELEEMADYGEKAIACLVSTQQRDQYGKWLELLDRVLARAGALDGADTPSKEPVTPQFSARPFVFDSTPKRDERFHDLYNQGVNAEAFLYDEKLPIEPKVLMMFFKRIREIDVPEMMASIIFETRDKPWGYYQDMTRQLWDEARHGMMGEIGFVSAGVDWTKIPITFNWSLNLNKNLNPLERHAVLYFIEQGLMPKTGKRFEWEVGVASKNPMSALFQDYDWADEVLHAQIGRNWYVAAMPSPKEAIDYGDRCWTKIVVDWETYRKKGLTEHRNWWPDLYREACKAAAVEPDPEALAFDTSYNGKRADLVEVSG